MSQQLPWLPRKLTQDEYEERKTTCTEQAVRQLVSEPAFSSWRDDKRLRLQECRRQEALRKVARQRTVILYLLLWTLVAAAGALRYFRPDLLHVPDFGKPQLLHLRERFQGISNAAKPALYHTNPRRLIALAGAQLQPLYQHLASQVPAGLTQPRLRVPHAASRTAASAIVPPTVPPTASSALSAGAQMPCAVQKWFADGPASSSSSSSGGQNVDASQTNAVHLPSILKPGLLRRMGGLLPATSIASMPSKSLSSLRQVTQRSLPALAESSFSPQLPDLLVPDRIVADRSRPADSAHASGLPVTKPACPEVACLEYKAEETLSLLQRMNRSSTSLAVYIAKMPMRTARSWGAFTKKSLLALPAAKQLTLAKLPSAGPVLSSSPPAAGPLQSAGTLARVLHPSGASEAGNAPSPVDLAGHAEAGLFRRFNRSSTPLADLIYRLPARTSQRLSALTRQTLLALPGPSASPRVQVTAANGSSHGSEPAQLLSVAQPSAHDSLSPKGFSGSASGSPPAATARLADGPSCQPEQQQVSKAEQGNQVDQSQSAVRAKRRSIKGLAHQLLFEVLGWKLWAYFLAYLLFKDFIWLPLVEAARAIVAIVRGDASFSSRNPMVGSKPCKHCRKRASKRALGLRPVGRDASCSRQGKTQQLPSSSEQSCPSPSGPCSSSSTHPETIAPQLGSSAAAGEAGPAVPPDCAPQTAAAPAPELVGEAPEQPAGEASKANEERTTSEIKEPSHDGTVSTGGDQHEGTAGAPVVDHPADEMPQECSSAESDRCTDMHNWHSSSASDIAGEPSELQASDPSDGSSSEETDDEYVVV